MVTMHNMSYMEGGAEARDIQMDIIVSQVKGYENKQKIHVRNMAGIEGTGL